MRPVVAPLLVGLLIVIGLTWPMLSTHSGMAQDWPNHLWYLWRQGLNIERDGMPSLFLSKGTGIFYPFYAFYGGTLYALGGALSVVLGDAPVKAYVISYMLGFGSAIGGFYWLARMTGLGRWLAMVPGFLFVSSSYLLTDAYARGAWPEFIAVCSIPLFVLRHLPAASGSAASRSCLCTVAFDDRVIRQSQHHDALGCHVPDTHRSVAARDGA